VTPMRIFLSLWLLVALACPAMAQAPVVWRGAYLFAGGRPSFEPCQAKTRLFIKDDTGMGELSTIPMALGADSGRPIFMEVLGVQEGAGLRVTAVRRAQVEGKGCAEDLRATELKASGNEPFWNLEITRRGITVQRPEDPKPVVFPYQPVTLQDGARVYRSERDRVPLTVVIRDVPCRDTMAPAFFPMTAEIVFGSKTYRGCAYPGDALK